MLAGQERKQRWEKVAVIAVPLAILVPFLILSPFPTTGLFHFAGLYFLLVTWIRTRRPPPAVNHLMDRPWTPGQFPVIVFYSADGTVYGKDAGAVTIMDSWMIFHGLESDFAFQRHQIDMEKIAHRGLLSSKTPEVGLRLEYEVTGHRFWVGLRAFDEVDGLGSDYKSLFRAAARDWMTPADSQVGPGTPTLPPVTPQPATMLSARIASRLWILPACVPAALLVCSYTSFNGGLQVFCGLLTCAVATLVTALPARISFKRESLLRSLTPLRPAPAEINRRTAGRESEQLQQLSLSKTEDLADDKVRTVREI